MSHIDITIIRIIFYGGPSQDESTCILILKVSTDFPWISKRFESPLIQL